MSPEKLLAEVALAPLTFSDPRVDYVEIQLPCVVYTKILKLMLDYPESPRK